MRNCENLVNNKPLKRLARVRLLIAALFGCIALCIVAPRAEATPLFVNSTQLSSGEPDPTGGIAIASQLQAFASPSFTGTLNSIVIAGDPSNPYGGLTFEYQLTNNEASANAMERLTVNDFVGFLTDASYQIPTANRPPTFDDRDASGNVVGFTFSNPIFIGPPIGSIGFGVLGPGQTSAWMVVQTDAIRFQSTSASVIDGFTATVPTYAPTLLIPEPSAIVLAALGLMAFAPLMLRKRRDAVE